MPVGDVVRDYSYVGEVVWDGRVERHEPPPAAPEMRRCQKCRQWWPITSYAKHGPIRRRQCVRCVGDVWRTWKPRPRNGFAALTSEQRRAMAARGGRAAQGKGTAHQWTSEEASAARRKQLA